MLLAIDVGNTQTHVGMFEGDELVSTGASPRRASPPPTSSPPCSPALLDLRDLRLGDVHAAMVSAVVPTLAHEYEQVIKRYFDGRGLLVGPEIKSGMPIRIDRPQELGADRLVNAIAAYERVGGACIAVDFGTAINYDVVSSAGEYLGGVISPGVEISLEALSARAARLPRVEIEKPAARDRQGHAGGDPGGRRLRLRRPGGRDHRPHPRGARRGGDGDRDRRLRRGDRARSASRWTRSTTGSRFRA